MGIRECGRQALIIWILGMYDHSEGQDFHNLNSESSCLFFSFLFPQYIDFLSNISELVRIVNTRTLLSRKPSPDKRNRRGKAIYILLQ